MTEKKNIKNRISGKVLIALLICFFMFAIGCSQETADKPVADNSLGEIKQRGKIVVGVQDDYPPMEFLDEQGNHAGFEIDLLKHLAEEMGVEIKFDNMEWQELFGAVKSERVDIIMATITITPERQEEMLFSIPYFDTGQTILVLESNAEITSAQDLAGKKISAVPGTTCEQLALEYTNESHVINHASLTDSLEPLRRGEVDAVINDYIGIANFANKNPDLKIVDEPLTQEFYGIATKLRKEALMDVINTILREMKRTGWIDELRQEWSI